MFQTAITKRAVTGSQFTIRHNVDYDANNAPGNLFPSAWNTNVEAEIRHPLLQGSGVEFNRIAGPNSTPGVYNGVLIARLNADVALTDFEIAVRDLVSNVENAYWDLYYGYRVLDARVKARDAALDTWRKIYALFEVESPRRRGGEGSPGPRAILPLPAGRAKRPQRRAVRCNRATGTACPAARFRTTGGVLMAERRLRLLDGPAAERRQADSADRRAGRSRKSTSIGTRSRAKPRRGAPSCAARSGRFAAASWS